MARQKLTRKAVSKQPTKKVTQTQLAEIRQLRKDLRKLEKEEGAVMSNRQQKEIPIPTGFELGREMLVGNLMQVAKGASRLKKET